MNNDIITLDNDIFINGHLVLRINYNTNINNIPIDNILNNISDTLTKASNEIAEKNTYILLLDFNQVKKKYIHLDKIKKILKFVQNDYPDKLEKCIVYNYARAESAPFSKAHLVLYLMFS